MTSAEKSRFYFCISKALKLTTPEEIIVGKGLTTWSIHRTIAHWHPSSSAFLATHNISFGIGIKFRVFHFPFLACGRRLFRWDTSTTAFKELTGVGIGEREMELP
jgi:hypothetical protein